MHNTLVLCATESNHDFENLKTYVNLVNSVVIFDTGLRNDEVHLIKSVFHEKKLIHIFSEFQNFSQIRNNALSFVPAETHFVIMPDDSWSIHGLTLQHLKKLKDYDIIQVSLHNENVEHKVMRIFKPHLRFKGSVHEFLELQNSKTNQKFRIAQINGTYFKDSSPYKERTAKRMEWDIEQLKKDAQDPSLTARSYFYLGQYAMLQQQNEKAMEYFLKRMEYEIDAEQEYVVLSLMSRIKFKEGNLLDSIILLKEAALRYKPRAKEAYETLYKLTNDPIYKKRSDSLTIGHTRLSIKK